MYQDPIVEEIHQARAQILAKHQGNFEAYFTTLMQTQNAHPDRYVSFELKNISNLVGINTLNESAIQGEQVIRGGFKHEVQHGLKTDEIPRAGF